MAIRSLASAILGSMRLSNDSLPFLFKKEIPAALFSSLAFIKLLRNLVASPPSLATAALTTPSLSISRFCCTRPSGVSNGLLIESCKSKAIPNSPGSCNVLTTSFTSLGSKLTSSEGTPSFSASASNLRLSNKAVRAVLSSISFCSSSMWVETAFSVLATSFFSFVPSAGLTAPSPAIFCPAGSPVASTPSPLSSVVLSVSPGPDTFWATVVS